MKNRLAITVFMLSICSNLSAQITTFQKYYDTLDSYLGNCVRQTFDGGYVICGSAYDSFSAQDAVILKTDSIGELMWVKVFGGPGSQGATHIEQLPDSNFIVLAFQNAGLSTDGIWLMKLNLNGDTIWTKSFSLGSGEITPTRLVKCYDNGFAITGYLNVNGSGNLDIFLLKVDVNGIVQWSKLYGGRYSENPYDIKQTSDSGFIMVGGGPDFSSPPNADVFILRTNSVGDSIWSKSYGFSNVDVANSVQQTSDNGFIIIGSSWSISGNDYDLYLIKTYANGDTAWTKLIGDNYENDGANIQISTDGGYFIEGTTATTFNKYDFYVVKTDSSGNMLWSKSYGSPSSEILTYAIQCKDGGIAMVGMRQTNGLSVFFVKTDGQGSVIGVNELFQEADPIRFYPNPMILSSSIDIPESIDLKDLKLYLYDSFGKLLLEQKVDVRSFKINRNSLSPGMYFLVLSNQVYHRAIKFVVYGLE